MATFPVTHYRLFNDPSDQYFGDQLNFFDPWRDFETFPNAVSTIPNNFRWINEPRSFVARRAAAASSYYKTASNFAGGNAILPPVPLPLPIPNPILPIQSEKFRVQLNVAGFKPETIKTRVEGRKVIVEGRQEEREPNGDFSTREIRKTYDLPENAGKRLFRFILKYDY